MARQLESAHRELMLGSTAGAALAAAQELLDDPVGAAPATVLAAQAFYVEDSCAGVIERLGPLVERLPSYTAAQLLFGRCKELVGDLPGAAAAFHAVAERSALAASRLEELLPRARDAAVARIRGWIAAGRTEEARKALSDLQRWAPAEGGSLEILGDLAGELGDSELELALVRRLAAGESRSREILERQALLELDVGDAGAGLEILERLSAEHRDDEDLAASLERARFAWRMTMLPEPARGLTRSPELDRGQLATLLYWVFPSVRYTRPAEAVIANDVLEHEHRTEIVRVVNLGVMEIDPNLHAFRPREPAERAAALRGLLRILERGGAGRCLDGTTVDSTLSLESTCRLAARCGLLDEPGDCLPQAVLSGAEATDLARRASRRLERS